MSVVVLSSLWCGSLWSVFTQVFPEIKWYPHLCLGILTILAVGIINFSVVKIAIDQFKLEYIQPTRRGTSVTDAMLYPVYVIVNGFGILYFSSWPWAIVPTLSNVEWSFQHLTLANTLGSFFGTMLIYDFIYYFGHRFMHSNVEVYKYVHKIHHQLNAPGKMFDNLYVHPFEIIFTWLLYAPLYFLPIHILTLITYLFTIYTTVAMFHTGIKFPSFLPLLNPTFHDDHHRLSKVNYSLLTEIPDLVFGTHNFYLLTK
jgi:sterol desaturase/sphingolipid hydroxylase (fatty acid hydroxylase superfamily)